MSPDEPETQAPADAGTDRPGRDGGPSARERRRERARSAGPSRAGSAWRRYRIHLVILLLFGSIVAALAVRAGIEYDCPGHWHSRMDVVVHGEPISFEAPEFTLEGNPSMPLSSHMHRGSTGIWHFEPQGARDCIPLGDALRHADVDLADGRMVLDGGHEALGQAGTYAEDGNNTLQVFTKDEGGWKNATASSVVARQLRPGEQVLVLYGDYTPGEVRQHQSYAAAQVTPGSSKVHASYVPVVGVAVIGLIALAGWNALSKKM